MPVQRGEIRKRRRKRVRSPWRIRHEEEEVEKEECLWLDFGRPRYN